MASVPSAVRRLQRMGVILSPAHHAVHHAPPHDSNYCITSGISNPVLTRIRFWPALLWACRLPTRGRTGPRPTVVVPGESPVAEPVRP
jgi:hypothetical protein